MLSTIQVDFYVKKIFRKSMPKKKNSCTTLRWDNKFHTQESCQNHSSWKKWSVLVRKVLCWGLNFKSIASPRRSVSQGATQKTAREKIKKARRGFLSPRFLNFFPRCFLRCALTNWTPGGGYLIKDLASAFFCKATWRNKITINNLFKTWQLN